MFQKLKVSQFSALNPKLYLMKCWNPKKKDMKLKCVPIAYEQVWKYNVHWDMNSAPTHGPMKIVKVSMYA